MKLAYIVGGLCLVLLSFAFAENGPQMGQPMMGGDQGGVPQTPCTVEAQKLCPSMEPGVQSFSKCLDKNKKALSKECLAFHTKMKEDVKATENILKTCKSDIQKLCPDALKSKDPQPFEYIPCLMQQEKTVAKTCQKALAKLPPPPQQGGGQRGPGGPGGQQDQGDPLPKLFATCKKEIDKLCAKVGKEPFHIIPCLNSNPDALSASCKTALDNLPPPPQMQKGQGGFQPMQGGQQGQPSGNFR